MKNVTLATLCVLGMMGCQSTKSKPHSMPLGEGAIECKTAKIDTSLLVHSLHQDTEFYAIPPKYEWVDGEIPGSSIEKYHVPATYKAVTETIVVTPKCYVTTIVDAIGGPRMELRPAITKTITKRILVTPSSIGERIVTNSIKDGRTRIMVEPSRIVERTISF